MLKFTTGHPTTPGRGAGGDPSAGVTRWVILNTAPKRWEIVSVRADGARQRHGAAYTLREAKEIVNRWHESNVAHAASA